MGGLFGGGGSHQNITQASNTNQSSTTNAQKYYTFEVSQSGLDPAQAAQLLRTVQEQSQQGQLFTALGTANVGLSQGSVLLWILVLLFFAAVVFKGR